MQRKGKNLFTGPEVEGKYSSDLFASRAKRLIKKHKTDGKPWFTYLSLQSVHDPIQVLECSYRHDYLRPMRSIDSSIISN